MRRPFAATVFTLMSAGLILTACSVDFDEDDTDSPDAARPRRRRDAQSDQAHDWDVDVPDRSLPDVSGPDLPDASADTAIPDSSEADAATDANDAAILDAAPDTGCTPSATRPCVAQLALGESHSCALLSDKTVRCWGLVSLGRLGIGDAPDAGPKVFTPTPVRHLANVTTVALGQQHACATLEDESIWCWGGNINGSLGINSTASSASAPTRVLAIGMDAGGPDASIADASIADASIPDSASDAAPEDASIDAAGDASPTANPVLPAGLTGVKAFGLGQDFTCTLLPATGATGACWGTNKFGQVGLATTTLKSLVPSPIALPPSKALAVGGTHACALLATKGVKCWGNNGSGQLGLGDNFVTKSLSVPTDVPGLANVEQIAAGLAHTCALLTDKSVKCWGYNNNSQLGVGLVPDGGAAIKQLDVPTPVEGLPPNVVGIALGRSHTCVLHDDGKVSCWGSNARNQLGGTVQTQATPTEVDGVTGAVELRAGFDHTCVRLADGSAQCWGQNANGQVGKASDGDGGLLTAVPTPTTIVWQ